MRISLPFLRVTFVLERTSFGALQNTRDKVCADRVRGAFPRNAELGKAFWGQYSGAQSGAVTAFLEYSARRRSVGLSAGVH